MMLKRLFGGRDKFEFLADRPSGDCLSLDEVLLDVKRTKTDRIIQSCACCPTLPYLHISIRSCPRSRRNPVTHRDLIAVVYLPAELGSIRLFLFTCEGKPLEQETLFDAEKVCRKQCHRLLGQSRVWR